jgi:hypothetical protein
VSTILYKIGKRIFQNRIKPLVIMQLILLIPYITFSIFALKEPNTVNYFYNGLGQIVLAVFFCLLGIENLLLKKKIFSLCFFAMAIIWIYIAIQSFHLYTLKG